MNWASFALAALLASVHVFLAHRHMRADRLAAAYKQMLLTMAATLTAVGVLGVQVFA